MRTLYFTLFIVGLFLLSCDQDIPVESQKIEMKSKDQLAISAVLFDGQLPALRDDTIAVNEQTVTVHFSHLLSTTKAIDDILSFVEISTGTDIKRNLKIQKEDSSVLTFTIPMLRYNKNYTLNVKETILSREEYYLKTPFSMQYKSDVIPKSAEKSLIAIYNGASGVLNAAGNEVSILVHTNMDLSAIQLDLQVSAKVTLLQNGQQLPLTSQTYSTTLDFTLSTPHQYTVRAENGSEQLYTIVVKRFSVTSSSFTVEGALPSRFGTSLAIGSPSPTSPQLSWSFAPTDAQSFIVMAWNENLTVNNIYWLLVDVRDRIAINEAEPVVRPLLSYQGVLLLSGETHTIHFTIFAVKEETIPFAFDDRNAIAPLLEGYARKHLANNPLDPPIPLSGLTILDMADTSANYTQD